MDLGRLSARSGTVLLLLVPVVVFQLLTAPISAHMVGRAGYRNGDFDPDSLVVDELAPDVDAARGADLLGGSWADERHTGESGSSPSQGPVAGS